MSLIDLTSLTFEEMRPLILELGLPSYRAEQVWDWVRRGATDFDEMSNLSKDLRTKLKEKFQICNIKLEKRLVSQLDDTVKYLYQLHDGEYIESVVMHYHHGYSICISTQAGCRMGCSFCATGKEGFSRNLTAGEMLSQITEAQRDRNIRISNVVLMGMGEPLDNYDNVLRFLRLVSSENGLAIGMRHISLSTCGIVPRIYDLAKENLQLTLSISLHAPNNDLRSQMMPINRKWDVDELLKACRYYADITGRRISYEYALVSGVNDSLQHAAQLASKLKGTLCHVNLIPVNPVDGTGYRESARAQIFAFQKELQKHQINATIRRTLGADIKASCGQLRQGKKRGETQHHANR